MAKQIYYHMKYHDDNQRLIDTTTFDDVDILLKVVKNELESLFEGCSLRIWKDVKPRKR